MWEWKLLRFWNEVFFLSAQQLRLCSFIMVRLCFELIVYPMLHCSQAAGWKRKAHSAAKRNEDLKRTAGTKAKQCYLSP